MESEYDFKADLNARVFSEVTEMVCRKLDLNVHVFERSRDVLLSYPENMEMLNQTKHF